MKNIIISAALAAALAASAQAASKLDTQVITATGFKNSLAQVADNLYVLDKSDIAEHGYKSVTEALRKVPGVDISENVFGTKVDMRGQGSNKSSQRVMVMVDGVLQNPADTSHNSAPLNMININDVEQIEIIPGGGAVIYGGGAVGGVINIITNAAKTKDFANVRLKYGSFDHFSGSAAGGAKIGENLYINLGAYAVDEKGYQKADKRKAHGFSGGIKAFIGDNQTLAINTRYGEEKLRASGLLSDAQMSKDRRQAGTVTHGFDPTPYAAENEEPIKTTQFDLSANYSIAIDEHQVSFMPFYAKNDFDKGEFVNSRYGAKLRAKLAHEMIDSNLGLDYLHDRGERDWMGTLGDVKKDTIAAFAHETVHVNDALDIAAGARYEHSRYDIYRFSPADKKRGTKAMSIKEKGNKQNNFAGSLLASYEVMDASRIYAKIERGFASPSAYELTDKDQNGYKLNDLNTESFMNYELGFKGLIANQFATVAMFFTDTKDEIINNGRGTEWKFENVGKTQRYGVEVGLEQSFLDDALSFYENFAYIKTKVKDDPKNTYREGQQIAGISPFSAALGGAYKFDSGFKFGADYRFYSKANWNYEGEKTKAFDPVGKKWVVVEHDQIKRKAYGVLDLNASMSMQSGLKIAAYALNVLGEKYNRQFDIKTNAKGVSTASYTPAAKQTFYVELSYEY